MQDGRRGRVGVARVGAALAAVALAASLGAQRPVAVLGVGEPLPGGAVVRILGHAVTDEGHFLARVLSSAAPDEHLVLDGPFSRMESGRVLAPGVEIDFFGDVGITDFCEDAYQLVELRGAAVTEASDRALVYADRLLLREGGPCGAPELPGGTYLELSSSRPTGDDACVVVARIADAAGIPAYALVRVDVDADANHNGVCDDPGLAFTERVLFRSGGRVPAGTGEVVRRISPFARTFDSNARGEHLLLAQYQLFTHRVIRNGAEVLAENGTSVPGVAGTLIVNDYVTRVDLNDFGDWVLATEVNSPNGEVLIKNGAKLYRTGDPVPDPAAGPFQLVDFGFETACGAPPGVYCPPDLDGVAPVLVTNGGDVLWFGRWNDPDPAVDQGLFVGDRLLVREGVTRDSAGRRILGFGLGRGQFRHELDVSANGRYVLLEAALEGVGAALLRIDLGEAVPYGTSVQGCSYPYAALGLRHASDREGGLPLLGQSFLCTLAGIPSGAQTMALVFATEPWPSFPCGVLHGGSELLLAPSTRVLRLVASPAPSIVVGPLPNDFGLLGLDVYAQAAFRAASGQLLGRTNGLRFVFGAF